MRPFIILVCVAVVIVASVSYLSADRALSNTRNVNWQVFEGYGAAGPALTRDLKTAREELQKLDDTVRGCRQWVSRVAWGGLAAAALSGMVGAFISGRQKEAQSTTSGAVAKWGVFIAVLISLSTTTQAVSGRLEGIALAHKQRADTLFATIKKVQLSGLEKEAREVMELRLELEGARRP